jgi:hypothetical protein
MYAVQPGLPVPGAGSGRPAGGWLLGLFCLCYTHHAALLLPVGSQDPLCLAETHQHNTTC